MVEHEARTCSRCGLRDSFVKLPEVAEIAWPDGRKYRVTPYRCLGCGSLDGFNREMGEIHKKTEETPGEAHPSDGFRSMVEPID